MAEKEGLNSDTRSLRENRRERYGAACQDMVPRGVDISETALCTSQRRKGQDTEQNSEAMRMYRFDSRALHVTTIYMVDYCSQYIVARGDTISRLVNDSDTWD